MAIKSKAKKSEMCDWCIIDDENSGDTWNYQGSEKGAFEYLAGNRTRLKSTVITL
jgi:hypothetical protein